MGLAFQASQSLCDLEYHDFYQLKKQIPLIIYPLADVKVCYIRYNYEI